MEETSRATPSQPASGGPIRLQAHLTDPGAWLWPAWAALCGVAASGGFAWQSEDRLRLALLILLVGAGWSMLWAALGSADWAGPLHQWRTWHTGDPLTAPPYTQPHSPGDRLSRWLGQLRGWWRHALRPACGPALSTIAAALFATATLAALLGPATALLSVAALAVMQLGLAWGKGQGAPAPMWRALITIALPWLAGHAAFGALTPGSAGLALAFALAQGAAWGVERRWKRGLNAGAQFVAAAILILSRRPLAAGGLGLLLFPQLALLPWLHPDRPASWYARHTWPWLAAAMIIAAWAL